jgi:hypothetical protein
VRQGALLDFVHFINLLLSLQVLIRIVQIVSGLDSFVNFTRYWVFPM